MNEKVLSVFLKVIILVSGLCLLLGLCFALFYFGPQLVKDYPEFSNRYLPWAIFLTITLIPCIVVLVLGWKVVDSIEKKTPFCSKNSKIFKLVSVLAMVDSCFFLLGNILLMLFNMSHFSVFLCSLAIVFVGLAIAVLSAIISHLFVRATDLKEQSDFTI